MRFLTSNIHMQEVNIKCGEFASEVNEMKSGYLEAVERADQLEVTFFIRISIKTYTVVSPLL